jgi:hypothetical protein
MKTAVTALVVCFAVAVSVSVSGFQGQTGQGQTPPTQQPPTQQPPPTQQKPAMPEVTLTGCIVQGSSPTVFIFDNAKKDPKSTTEKGVRYVAVIAAEDVDLRKNLNHEVQMTGQIELKAAPPAGQKVEEKDLPRFSAKTLTSLSDTCGAVR